MLGAGSGHGAMLLRVTEVLPPILNCVSVASRNTIWERKFSQFLGNLERQTAWPGLLHKTIVSATLLPPLGEQICGRDPTSRVGEEREINWARASLTAAEVSASLQGLFPSLG